MGLCGCEISPITTPRKSKAMILAWFLLLQTAQGAVLPKIAGIRSSNHTKAVLPPFLESLASVHLWSDSSNDNAEKLVIFPKEVFTVPSLEYLLSQPELGLVRVEFPLNSVNGPSVGSNIVLPADTSLMFIFNSTESIKVPPIEDSSFVDFLRSSPPFLLPPMLNLEDYFLVVPLAYVSATDANGYLGDLKSNHINEVSKAPLNVFPMFRKCIREHLPTLVLVFNEDNSSFFDGSVNTIMNTKSLTSEGTTKLSSFFDLFAKAWLSDVNYETLVKSISCTVNIEDSCSSYCVGVQDDTYGSLFPVFDDFFFPPFGSPVVLPLPDGPLIVPHPVGPPVIMPPSFGPPSGFPFSGPPVVGPGIVLVPDPLDPGRLILLPANTPSENGAVSGSALGNSSTSTSGPLKSFVSEANSKQPGPPYDVISFPLSLIDLNTETSSPRSKNYSQIIFKNQVNAERVYSNHSGLLVPQTEAESVCLDVNWYSIFHHFGATAKQCWERSLHIATTA